MPLAFPIYTANLVFLLIFLMPILDKRLIIENNNNEVSSIRTEINLINFKWSSV